MTLNGVMAVILRYFTEFVYDVVVKKFTFAISSPDEFLYICGVKWTAALKPVNGLAASASGRLLWSFFPIH